MQWGDTQYLLFLLLIPILVGLLIFLFKIRKKSIERFCDPQFIQTLAPLWSPSRLVLKQIFLVLTFVFLILCLAEPKWGYHFEEVIRKGNDLFLIVDLSNSMLAEDLKPNRLERAKRKIRDLLKMANGDRIGMIVFAGRSILICPLTLDYQAVEQFLNDLSPDLIPIQGTDLSGAFKLAMNNFRDPKSSKALIVLSDGEDHSDELESTVNSLKEKKIPLYILGFGTPEGAPVPLPKGEGGFKRDRSGNIVISKLEEQTLAEIAKKSGGVYIRSVTNDEDLNELYVKDLKGALKGNEIKSGKKRVYESRFQWPLGFAFLVLLIELSIGENRKIRIQN